MPINVWGTGRKDYSENIEESVISIARSHQYRVHSAIIYDLRAYDWATIDVEPIIEGIVISPILENYDHLWYTIEVAFDANVLIKGYAVLYNSTAGTVTRLMGKFGYKKIRFEFPVGHLITKEQTEAGIRPGILFLPGGYFVGYTSTYIQDKIA